MELQEAYDLYLASETIADPFAAAPDLEYVIYPEEEDYDWRFITLPIDSVGADLSLEPTDGCEKEDEDQRFSKIKAWMDGHGALNALAASPPIARMTDRFGLDLVDGRHRLALAHQAGITHIKFMVGAAPGWSPSIPSLPDI